MYPGERRDESIMTSKYRPTSSELDFCNFCTRIVTYSTELLTSRPTAVYYPAKDRYSGKVFLPKPLASETCFLCKYILSLIQSKETQLSEDALQKLYFKNATCYRDAE